jgi:hypothetical protein
MNQTAFETKSYSRTLTVDLPLTRHCSSQSLAESAEGFRVDSYFAEVVEVLTV